MTPYAPVDTLFAMHRETFTSFSGISHPSAADRRPDPLGMAWVGLLTKLQALRGFRPSAARPGRLGRVGERRPA